jgi:L,D-peptidoglycan transpeptidase YkuD (ErfK/YbiS/YcfS/YnhG family)
MAVPLCLLQGVVSSQCLDVGKIMQVFAASASGWMIFGDQKCRCAIGKGGVKPTEDKVEGDGASPLGQWPIRRVLWRPDRGPQPLCAFPTTPIKEDDGWCDAPDDPSYNMPITHPYPARAEHLWREDGLYDIVVILGHNDDPIIAGKGSAIFMHCASSDYRPTEGCVALSHDDLRLVLSLARPGDAVAFTR